MAKPKLYLLRTGGTIEQQKDVAGVLGFTQQERSCLDEVSAINTLADIVSEKVDRIDSTDMTTGHRVMMARKIHERYHEFDGFVITHGTDTMPETAAALTYMLQGLGKPVVLTGSQISIFEPGSDAPHNLYYAIKTATMDLGEVVLAFGSAVLRGSHSIKYSENDFDAFASPRVEPIARIGLDVYLANHRVRRSKSVPALFTDFDEGVAFYQQNSGSNGFGLEPYIESEKISGIVLGGFGAGNVQSKLVPGVKAMTEKGKPVVVITNCLKGFAEMGVYAVGSAALEAGAISGGDMTREAATQKLMYALGKAREQGYEGKEKVEIVKSVFDTPYGRDVTPYRVEWMKEAA